MPERIALLRGINVGGKNKLPMAELVQILEQLKLKEVRTYIQSGNVVFRSGKITPEKLAQRITDGIESEKGFAPTVLVYDADEFREIVEANPFAKAVAEPKHMHYFFLERDATDADADGIAMIAATSEQFTLQERVFLLHAPDGIGRSKLVGKIDKLLGVPTTARNLRTIEALLEMLS